jgi:preprotein translocase subunit SecD
MRVKPDVALFYRFFTCCLAAVSLMTAAVAEPLALDVQQARVGRDERTGQVILKIKLADAQRERWLRFTSENLARQIELRIDGRTVLTAFIREVMPITSFQVTVPTAEQAEDIADKLAKGGARVEVEVAPNQ